MTNSWSPPFTKTETTNAIGEPIWEVHDNTGKTFVWTGEEELAEKYTEALNSSPEQRNS